MTMAYLLLGLCVVAWFFVGMAVAGFLEAMDEDLNPHHQPHSKGLDLSICMLWPVALPFGVLSTRKGGPA
jgi:hypothetical protein